MRINEAAPKRPPVSAPPTILVVEDDEITAMLLTRILKANDFRVIHAADRAGILSGLKASPDLVILDVLMPDANGFDILNRMRAEPKLADLPVLMLTSLGALDDILKGLKFGANGYLTKPAKSKALLDDLLHRRWIVVASQFGQPSSPPLQAQRSSLLGRLILRSFQADRLPEKHICADHRLWDDRTKSLVAALSQACWRCCTLVERLSRDTLGRGRIYSSCHPRHQSGNRLLLLCHKNLEFPRK